MDNKNSISYNLTKFEKKILDSYYKLHVNRVLEKKTSYLPHHLIIREYIKKSLCYKKYGKFKEGCRYISEKFFGFSVGKYSYGYEQFWGKNNNGRFLLSIGSFTAIANNVTIASGNHPIQFISLNGILYDHSFGFIKKNLDIRNVSKNEKVTIGSDVWIGCNVTILPGVNIGDGSVIAAGSVVTKDVLPYSVVAGIPAKHKKYRFDEASRKKLLENKWWEKNDSYIKTNLSDMYDIEQYIRSLTS
ncbi:TPA: CatB-related O-acetyltransferase [Vibrio vulnificus]